MSDVNLPPPTIEVEGPDKQPTEICFTKEEANFFLYVVDFYRTIIQDVTTQVPPLELVFILAFLQAAIESQAPHADQAFDETRAFFRQVYPAIMSSVPPGEVQPEEGQLLIVIPKPSPQSCAVTPMGDEPRIILPGTGSVN